MLLKKIQYLLILLSCIFNSALSQVSPIKWKSTSFSMNIDTTYNNKLYNFNKLKYTFSNQGDHVTFIDTNQVMLRMIAKPKETFDVSLDLPYSDFSTAYRFKRDTTIFLTLPFYYEGKIFREKLSYQLTFGKSKLIEHDDFILDVTDEVARMIMSDTAHKHPSIKLTKFFTIKNISDKPIFVLDSYIAYNDAPSIKNFGNKFMEIKPNQIFKIPVELMMDRKYKFTCRGEIEIFTDGMREVFQCEIKSSVKRLNE